MAQFTARPGAKRAFRFTGSFASACPIIDMAPRRILFGGAEDHGVLTIAGRGQTVYVPAGCWVMQVSRREFVIVPPDVMRALFQRVPA